MAQTPWRLRHNTAQFPTQINRESISRNREFLTGIREFDLQICEHFRKRPFLAHLSPLAATANLFSLANVQVRRTEMSSEVGSRIGYGALFWRAHHEAWQQSALNQREYCEAQGIPDHGLDKPPVAKLAAAANRAGTPRQKSLNPRKLVVAQSIALHRKAS
jgi:hypothetical protein